METRSNKRFWGTAERPYLSYNIGYLHDAYEEVGFNPVRVKEDIMFYDFRRQLINKYAGRINI